MKPRPIAGSIGVLLLLVLALWPRSLWFRIADDAGVVLHARPVRPGERVTLSYIHSVTKRTVTETWEVSPRAILILRETEFDSFGAGLPAELGPGERLAMKDGRMRITGMHRELPDLRVAVGRTAAHTLHFGTEHLALRNLAEPGARLSIEVKRCPWWYRLFGK